MNVTYLTTPHDPHKHLGAWVSGLRCTVHTWNPPLRRYDMQRRTSGRTLLSDRGATRTCMRCEPVGKPTLPLTLLFLHCRVGQER